MSEIQRYKITDCKFLCSTIQKSGSGQYVRYDDIKDLLRLKAQLNYCSALRQIKEIMKPGRYTMRRKIMYIESIIRDYDL